MLTAPDLLRDPAEQPTAHDRYRQLRPYTAPDLLAIQEVRKLTFDADLLCKAVHARDQQKLTLLTTNRQSPTLSKVVPNCAAMAVLAERLTHHTELAIPEGDS